MEEKRFRVTPWEVEGRVDYDELIRMWGTQRVTDELLDKIERRTRNLHLLLRRKVFYSHRDLDWILDIYEEEKFVLYTGRGPSGPVHIGHLIPWILCKYLQDSFDTNLYFQITDDEKFLLHPEFSAETAHKWAYHNALDVIAVGFDPEKSFLFSDMDYAKTLYNMAIRIAKHITLSTAKAVFGFKDHTNIGMIFYPAIQIAPCFFPSELEGRKTPILIPAAIDQDPYWRVTRDIAEKMGYYKPAQIHGIFLPSLLGPSGKMSASESRSAIYTVDTEEDVRTKIMDAVTGGQPTIDEQRRFGGDPDICVIYQYLYFLFEEDDKNLLERRQNCRSGNLLCGECKEYLVGKITPFLREFQRKREKAKDVLDDFLIKD